ncbi:MAG: HAD family hydrolase [Planctomycetaceae bacterium]|nr:HAD family hydrolase [Planctomycetaceae bacterium]
MNESHLCEIIAAHASPMEARGTDVEPVLSELHGIRAVLFDVYGTLVISGSGDVGTTDLDSRPQAFPEALSAVGVPFNGAGEEGVRLLTEVIAEHHRQSKSEGVEFPEVDIREVWSDVLLAMVERDWVLADAVSGHSIDVSSLALEYEVRTNPTWPMPGAEACLDRLRQAGLLLGIVSNAQCFTPLLFDTQLGRSLDEFGFDESSCVWSFEHKQAKPGTFLYERAKEAVAEQGIAAREVLFVGNDMLKDVWPASRVGFRTALFAGDASSYRPREDDARVANVTPDLVLTELAQLPKCVR